uniref:C-type lectin domain-containing protein n=1 Tax=Sinocyclocheilus rhinocerous TaxID=307959 RepID=A0A673N063_9TELE
FACIYIYGVCLTSDGQPDTPYTAFCCKSSGGELYDFWSWEEALEHCRSQHSGLACLPTSLHLFQANNKTADMQTDGMWTGLRFLAGSWFWVNGESLGNLVQTG